MDRALNIVFRVSLVLIFGFMVLPMLIVVIASFSPTNVIDLSPSSLSLQWYAKALTPTWLVPIKFSLQLAAYTALVSTALGMTGAFAFAYLRCPFDSAVKAFLMSPISAPQLVIGIALLQFLATWSLHTKLGIYALLAGHVLVTVPFAIRMIANNVYSFDRTLERAASVLGASPLQTLWHVILPAMKPGVFAALTFSFILSFNDIPISLFLAQASTKTLPIAVLNYLEYRIDPGLAAVNMVCLILVVAIVALLERFGKFSRTLY